MTATYLKGVSAVNLAEIQDRLLLKLEILEKIGANTDTQSRFIRKRELRGLRRLLRERAALISELEAVSRELESVGGWEGSEGLQAMARTIAAKQREIMDRANAVLREAVTERERIGSELKNIRIRRRAAREYAPPRMPVPWGGRFNAKG